jgi:hypothetical protein
MQANHTHALILQPEDEEQWLDVSRTPFVKPKRSSTQRSTMALSDRCAVTARRPQARVPYHGRPYRIEHDVAGGFLCRDHDAVYHARRHSALRQKRSAKQTEPHREPITTRGCSKAIPIGGVYLHPFKYNPIPEPELKRGMTSFLAEDLSEQKERLCDFRLGRYPPV